MKKIMNTVTHISFVFLLVAFNAISMDKPAKKTTKKTSPTQRWVRVAGEILLGNVPVSLLSAPQKNPALQQDFPGFRFTDLPQDLQNIIILYLVEGTNTREIKEAARSIASLAQVNHALNELINSRYFCLKIIKNLSQKFNQSNYDVCTVLSIERAKIQHALQKKLFFLCMNPEENESSLPELLSQGVDLDFTYDVVGDIVTPLMIACLDDNIIMAHHLIQAGANVNQTNPEGITALMMIAPTNNLLAMQQLIDNPNININQKDNEGDTALMYAIRAKNNLAIKALLAKGANPYLPNVKGITPIQSVKETNNPAFINLVEEAIEMRKDIP